MISLLYAVFKLVFYDYSLISHRFRRKGKQFRLKSPQTMVAKTFLI